MTHDFPLILATALYVVAAALLYASVRKRSDSWRKASLAFAAAGMLVHAGAQINHWFGQDVPRHRTHFTPGGARALLERSGFRVERIRQVLVEQNPLGMWQTLLNRLTVERDFAFRLSKGDLDRVPDAVRRRDLAVSVLAGALLAPVAVLLELGAGLAGRGGSMVIEARARGG